MDLAGVLLGELHRLLSALRHQDGVAIGLEHLLRQCPHHGLVFDQQDRRPARRRACHLALWLPGGRATIVPGKVDTKRGPLPRSTLDIDIPIALHDDAVDRRQAQACPPGSLLGGEEGLENVR